MEKKKRKKKKKSSYGEEDELEDDAGLVSSPVGVGDDGADDGEDVGGAGPVAHILGSVGVVELHHHPHEGHQVDAHAVHRHRRKRLVYCILHASMSDVHMFVMPGQSHGGCRSDFSFGYIYTSSRANKKTTNNY